MNPLKSGPWNLSDLKDIIPNNKKVFSCFHCGGGSTMGYKLSGYEVIGGVEIDPAMMEIYKLNHNPKYSYLMGVQQFKKIPNESLPKELFELDILDGSPPCSSFSMAGSREDAWGENKKFREGQSEQVLDDLFFDFVDIAKKLKPKIVVAENVKGLIQGKARGYVKQIYQQFNKAGYDVQLFLLNAAFMGVPQKRERTFFIARRRDLNFPFIKLNFNEKTISVFDSIGGVCKNGRKLSEVSTEIWKKLKPGGRFSEVKNGSRFNDWVVEKNNPSSTITANGTIAHFEDPRRLSEKEFCRIQSFPDDYNFLNTGAQYLCGMSVPPFMMQRVADQIYKQWLV